MKNWLKYNNNAVSKLMHCSKNDHNTSWLEAKVIAIDLSFDYSPHINTKLLENLMQKGLELLGGVKVSIKSRRILLNN